VLWYKESNVEVHALRPSGEEEYQMWQGMPASLSPLLDPGRADGAGLRGLLRPLTWLRWRAAVRHQGPFALDFDEFRRRRASRVR
jgi:hypothetical protein